MDRTFNGIALCIATAALTTTALGHGSMETPISRVYAVYLANPENPQHPAHQYAVDACGTQAFYDWHELSRTNWDYGTYLFNGGAPDVTVYQDMIPDGQIISAARDKYACLDAPRDDWPTTDMTPGPHHFVFHAHVPHNPSIFHAWITTDAYDPLSPLAWNDLEVLPISNVVQNGMRYEFDADIPHRTGRHIIYVAWQRIDPAGEVFFSTSDVMFEAEPCTGDTNDDGVVGVDDALGLLSAWGGTDPAFDLDANGAVGVGDLLLLLEAWGDCG